MHPAYTADKPGTAPDCGMPLEPVYADAHGSGVDGAAPSPDTIAISTEKQQLMGYVSPPLRSRRAPSRSVCSGASRLTKHESTN
jgi:hypothetical protein